MYIMTLSAKALFNTYVPKTDLIETKIPSATVLVNISQYDTDKQLFQALQILIRKILNTCGLAKKY